MTVRVTASVQTEPFVRDHAEARQFAREESGALSLYDAKGHLVVAYAPGMWASAELLPEAAVKAPAEPVAHCDSCNATHVVLPEPCPEQVVLEPVLSETTEPYVCVSVTGPDPETVVATLAKLG